jgi:hypothetical protein
MMMWEQEGNEDNVLQFQYNTGSIFKDISLSE